MNKEHYDKLKEGVKAWNKWRRENPDIIPDLSKANLSNADFSYANLSDTDLSNADLSYANFKWAILTNANLSDADIRGANFSQKL